jgi:hypothetical protein
VIPAQPGQFDPQQRVSVLNAMGDYGEPQLKPHPFLVRCTMCDGRGKLDTGSQNPGYEAESCEGCGGTGRTDSRQPATNGNYGPPPTQTWTPPRRRPSRPLTRTCGAGRGDTRTGDRTPPK